MIAAVVLNYNSSERVETCIAYLREQVGVQLEIVVVDNASEGEQVSSIRSACAGRDVVLLESPVNGGYSAGNNIGLRYAVTRGAEWVLIVNPDVELRQPAYLHDMLACAESFPAAAVIGSDVILPDGRHQNPMRELTLVEEIMWPLDAIRARLGHPVEYLGDRTTGYCDKLSGCCLLIRGSYLISHGYFDEQLFLYSEEPVLAKQVRVNGWRMLYVDELLAHHMHLESSASPPRAMQMMLRSRCYYLEVYSGYPLIPRRVAIASRRFQMLAWRMLEWRRGISRMRRASSPPSG